ncbi:MFS general substrate transporter [Massarina eburnea CBS 473.64]|uniref:MFS general substrate transporter n=1 Tax=Massarina eburnea CBS 473.64 TaxID=1395130 RepID=A0A6A6RN07_9PLEO|nr:MFS general substrate transporter [Massarina eburnea CBS 473.64]
MDAVADEQQPLLGPILEENEDAISVRHDGITEILHFELGDDEDPRQWTKRFRWFIVLLLACMATTVTFTCIGVVPVATRIVSELSGGSSASTNSTSALLVTIWELGEAAGPLLIAPLSEIFGRYPVMNVCNIGFIFSTLLAVSSNSTSLFIVARMLTGLTVASNVLNPAIIGDLFESDERGSAMSLIMLAPLIGGAIGPAISGAIAQTLGWRWVLLIAAGMAVCCEILFLTCFRETYKVTILKKRARLLREASDGYDEVSKGKGSDRDVKKLWHAMTRPFAVLFGSRVLILLSLFGSVLFSFFYVMSTSLPNILQDLYGFTPAQTGSSLITFSVGSFISVVLCNATLDRVYIYLRARSPNHTSRPEHRLPIAIIGGALLPFSVAAYGWIAEKHLPVFVLLLSVGILGFTLMLAMIPMSAYVVDAFGNYSASAMTGVIVTRCLMGTFLPLATGALAEKLGWGWGCTCLGAVSAVLVVCPVAIFRYGEKWRLKSEFTRD